MEKIHNNWVSKLGLENDLKIWEDPSTSNDFVYLVVRLPFISQYIWVISFSCFEMESVPYQSWHVQHDSAKNFF